ncbi:MAG TPA: amidohydrolase family protein [Gaiellaceae bacterium]|nr:amidohydrolase family protein [Gaiellaceae bacterium]
MGSRLVLLALLVVVGMTAARAAPADPFSGTWISVDLRDGSSQTLVLKRSKADSYDVTLTDDRASACGGEAVTGRGVGTAAGTKLSAPLTFTCPDGKRLEATFVVTYRAGDDTLVDDQGAVWARVKAAPTATEIVLKNAVVLTMDPRRPRAQAVLVRGQRITAVGTNAAVQRKARRGAKVIDLRGRVVVPGFIDSHSHRLRNYGNVGYTRARSIREALEQGWTTLSELYVDDETLAAFRALDESGALPLRINAYLTVNTLETQPLGDWYTAYRPRQVLSPRLRVAGLKYFVDFDSCKKIGWTQAELTAAIVRDQRNGWPIAAKSVCSRSLEMILEAFDAAQRGNAGPAYRNRIEHLLSATRPQIAHLKRLGAVASIQTNIPGELVDDQDFLDLVKREPRGAMTPWRSLVKAGVVIAGGSAWPTHYVRIAGGAPFASPLRLLYQAATRAGNPGQKPLPWMLSQTITVEQALRALTINAAYATFEDKQKGSITAGKLADLVVFSANPLAVPVLRIPSIRVLATMIGGKVESCVRRATRLCP